MIVPTRPGPGRAVVDLTGEKTMRVPVLWRVGWLVLALAAASRGEEPPLATYFRAETERIANRPMMGIRSAEEWVQRRPELRRQLAEMLGLWPEPERTPLDARVTGTVERPDFVVEKILFQSRPGLYVTGNLYRPKVVEAPLPAILYVCGHSKVEKDGVIFGCKAHYQHHAAWYAANGYVCLVVDTLQLGELPGLHHGTHHLGMWWWQSRGYTPAGVEAWNGIRAIDYLVSRPEVDASKIGVTGRSGGGATSWWVGALDDRVSVVVPVAGITDLKNHVVDGKVEGHCDCMFPVNTFRWDFPLVAALIAPKALLVENTDHDPIFPEDGVRRVFEQLETVYRWQNASDRLALVIGQGGHVDTPEIRHPSFAFMDRWLRGRAQPIVDPDRKVPIEDLKVLKVGEVPPGNHNDTIHETFVAPAATPPVPASAEEWGRLRARWMDDLRTKVFGGWPAEDEAVPLDMKLAWNFTLSDLRYRFFEFTSQTGVPLGLVVAMTGDVPITRVTLRLLDDQDIREAVQPKKDQRKWPYGGSLAEPGHAIACLAPRGIGPRAWPANKDTHIRRRFALLGQTLDGMRVWDARRALAALRSIDDLKGASIELEGAREAASWALWASVFEPEVAGARLIALPATVRDGPALLNLQRILDVPQALALLHPRPVSLVETPADVGRWAAELKQAVGGGR
jgi:dienelactone hydrolase